MPLIAAQDMNQPTVSRIDKKINEKLMFQLMAINVHEKNNIHVILIRGFPVKVRVINVIPQNFSPP